MRHTKLTLFVGIGILVLSLLMCVLSVFEYLNSSSMAREIQQLKASSGAQQIDRLNDELKQQQQENSDLSSRLNELTQNYRQMQGQYNDLQTQLNKIQQMKAEKGSGHKVAYLTFDDGPSPITPQVLDALRANGVRATFFVVGTCAQEYPDFVRREYAEGNVVGVHSWTHNYSYIYKNETNFFEDFNRLRDYLTGLLGVAPTVCRYPGGTNNTVSQKYSDHIMRSIDPQVKAMGLKPFDWNSYAGDADSGPKPTPVKIVQSVMNSSSSEKTTVILMHDTAVNANDIAALPELIRELKAEGFTFGTLSASTPTVQFKPY